MRIASYQTDGMHAGLVVTHRTVSGPQLWTVVVSVERGLVQDSYTVKPKEKVRLGNLSALVQKLIEDLCKESEPLTRASMEFFVRRQGR